MLFFAVGEEAQLDQDGGHGAFVEDEESRLLDAAIVPAVVGGHGFLHECSELEALLEEEVLHETEDDERLWGVGVVAFVFGGVVAFVDDDGVFSLGHLEVGFGFV